MTREEIKERYKEIQTAFKFLGSDGCYFLALCTIIEENTGKEVDLIRTVKECLKFGWIESDYTVINPLAMLSHYTGQYCSMAKINSLPATILDNEYTIEKWFNPRTGYTHFKRRFVDTLKDSVTVKEGYIQEYYIFKIGK